MEDTKIVPKWLLTTLQILHAERDRLKAIADEKNAAYEAARRACVVPDQLLSKINDAIQSLNHAVEWTSGTVYEVPL